MADGWLAFERNFQFRNAAKFIERLGVIEFQQLEFLQRVDVVNRNVHAVNRAQDAAAALLHFTGKRTNFSGRLMEKVVELAAKARVVGGDGGQNAGMIKRRLQRLLQFANPGDNSRLK